MLAIPHTGMPGRSKQKTTLIRLTVRAAPKVGIEKHLVAYANSDNILGKDPESAIRPAKNHRKVPKQSNDHAVPVNKALDPVDEDIGQVVHLSKRK